MGSSHSKPSKPSHKKPKVSKSAISYPKSHHNTTLSYPHLEPLPFRPLPHHPAAPRPTPEQELRARVAHFQKPEPAYHRPQAPPPPSSKQSHPMQQPVVRPQRAQAQPKPKQPYQFKPLDDIGRAPVKNPAKSSKTAMKKNQGGYSLYPALQRGDNNGRALRPGARFGGTRQDRHGEWWVLVLADGRWHRSGEVGVRGLGC